MSILYPAPVTSPHADWLRTRLGIAKSVEDGKYYWYSSVCGERLLIGPVASVALADAYGAVLAREYRWYTRTIQAVPAVGERPL